MPDYRIHMEMRPKLRAHLAPKAPRGESVTGKELEKLLAIRRALANSIKNIDRMVEGTSHELLWEWEVEKAQKSPLSESVYWISCNLGSAAAMAYELWNKLDPPAEDDDRGG